MTRNTRVRFSCRTQVEDEAGFSSAVAKRGCRRERRPRGSRRRILFAGGYLGAAIEGDRCHCDDPGLKGAVIGAPIGAATGGILGWRYLF